MKYCLFCEKPLFPPQRKYCRPSCGWKKRNAEKKEYAKEWHKERMKDPEFAEKRRVQAKEYRKKQPKKRLLRGAKDRAKKKGIPCEITIDDIVIPEYCPILGCKLEVLSGPNSPSLDRINPALGYIKGNIQVISCKANVMKNDATEDELRKFAEWVKNNYPV